MTGFCVARIISFGGAQRSKCQHRYNQYSLTQIASLGVVRHQNL